MTGEFFSEEIMEFFKIVVLVCSPLYIVLIFCLLPLVFFSYHSLSLVYWLQLLLLCHLLLVLLISKPPTNSSILLLTNFLLFLPQLMLLCYLILLLLLLYLYK